MMVYIFTFSWGQVHPVTKETLRNKFVRVEGRNFRDARRKMTDMFGNRWDAQYESEWQAGVEDRKLIEIEQLDREDWSRGMDLAGAAWVGGSSDF